MQQLVSLTQTPNWTAALFGGKDSSYLPLAAAGMWVKGRKQQIDHVIFPPSDHRDQGFQSVRANCTNFVEHTEGAVIAPGKTVAIASGDCTVVVAYNQATGVLAATHAGRPALTSPPDCDACSFTVVCSLLDKIAPRGKHVGDVHVFMTGFICGNCYVFSPDRPEAAAILDRFRQRHPNAIVGETGLDITTVATNELTARGVPAEQIAVDAVCTYEDPRLASYRRRDRGRNLTVITHHPRGAP